VVLAVKTDLCWDSQATRCPRCSTSRLRDSQPLGIPLTVDFDNLTPEAQLLQVQLAVAVGR